MYIYVIYINRHSRFWALRLLVPVLPGTRLPWGGYVADEKGFRSRRTPDHAVQGVRGIPGGSCRDPWGISGGSIRVPGGSLDPPT